MIVSRHSGSSGIGLFVPYDSRQAGMTCGAAMTGEAGMTGEVGITCEVGITREAGMRYRALLPHDAENNQPGSISRARL